MKIPLVIVALILVASNFVTFYIVDRKRTSVEAMPLNYVPPGRFNRGELISKVSRGDKDAAFELGTYYARNDLPEAAYYWFGVASKLGHKGVNQEFLGFYENTIVGQFDVGPWPKESKKNQAEQDASGNRR